MSKVDLTGLSPEIIAYINSLEIQLAQQTQRVEKLTTMLSNLQKSMYGQSSEKSQYIFGEQISIFNEAEVEYNTNAEEPKRIEVAGHTRKAKRTKEELAAHLPIMRIRAPRQGLSPLRRRVKAFGQRDGQRGTAIYPGPNASQSLLCSELCL